MAACAPPDPGDHTKIVASASQDAIIWQSCDHRTQFTGARCSSNVASHRHEAGAGTVPALSPNPISQTLTVPSWAADANSCRSLKKPKSTDRIDVSRWTKSVSFSTEMPTAAAKDTCDCDAPLSGLSPLAGVSLWRCLVGLTFAWAPSELGASCAKPSLTDLAAEALTAVFAPACWTLSLAFNATPAVFAPVATRLLSQSDAPWVRTAPSCWLQPTPTTAESVTLAPLSPGAVIG
mmetsp:Transcript_101545/g.295959  ORF Transcript_101545/g.295959 Transcript_101545/m.295959 type:complete len:235 (-) Transcript_101545:187-891(-)